MKRIIFAFLFALAPAVHAEIKEQIVEYKDGDATLEGRLIFDDASTAPRPGVVIFHQWSGPSEHEILFGHQIAKLGYAAFVADVYGKGIRPVTPEERMVEVSKYKSDRALMRRRANAALLAFGGQPGIDAKKLDAAGFCFGGMIALELARSGANLRGAASFHGGLDTPHPDDAKQIKGKILVLHGADDPYTPADQVAAFETEMRNAGVDWELVKYGGAVHAFTQKDAGADNSKGAAYNEKAAHRSWDKFVDFMEETIR